MKEQKEKKELPIIAFLAKGKYYPLHFYQTAANQYIPPSWRYRLYLIQERSIEEGYSETQEKLKGLKSTKDRRQILDRRFYKKVATEKWLRALGWKITTMDELKKEPFEYIVVADDDCLILNVQLIHNILEAKDKDEWDILSNSSDERTGGYSKKLVVYKRDAFLNGSEKALTMSPVHRMSMFCIEGKDGFISNVDIKESEEKGLDLLQHYGYF